MPVGRCGATCCERAADRDARPGPYLRLSPLKHGTDGFFAAALVRKSERQAGGEATAEATEMIRIRRASRHDAAAIGRVHVETWQATYAGLLPDAMLVGMSDVRQSAWWSRALADPGEARGVFVADDEDMGVVGFGSCGPVRDPPDGLNGREISGSARSTRSTSSPISRTCGLGRRLLDALFRQLKADRCDTAVLWMLAAATRPASSTRGWAASGWASGSTRWAAPTSTRSPTPGATSARR